MMKQLTYWGSILILAVGPLAIKGDDGCCIVNCEDEVFKTQQVGTAAETDSDE